MNDIDEKQWFVYLLVLVALFLGFRIGALLMYTRMRTSDSGTHQPAVCKHTYSPQNTLGKAHPQKQDALLKCQGQQEVF